MKETIRTLDLVRWSEPDEQHRVKQLGMANAQEIFDKLKAHLEGKGLLPDEYFLFHDNFKDSNGELPETYNVICNTNFGASEGIYLDISLQTKDNPYGLSFATGKTLDDSAQAFYRISRIGAECSFMLNGMGVEFQLEQPQKISFKLNPKESTLYTIIEQQGCSALLKRSEVEADPTPYVIAQNISINSKSGLISWDSGQYFENLKSAVNIFSERSVELSNKAEKSATAAKLPTAARKQEAQKSDALSDKLTAAYQQAKMQNGRFQSDETEPKQGLSL